MQQRAITAGRFNGVAEGVPKIENHAYTGLALIQTHHLGLHPYGGGDHLLERSRVALGNEFAVTFDETEEGRIPDKPSFDVPA